MSIEKFLSNVVVDGTISKVGGTSTQFLKADGSVDSSVYELNSNKQNNLAVDGTGTKYPTVDAVVEGIKLNSIDLWTSTSYPFGKVVKHNINDNFYLFQSNLSDNTTTPQLEKGVQPFKPYIYGGSYVGVWSAGSYVAGNIVSRNSFLYYCLTNTETDPQLLQPPYWLKIGVDEGVFNPSKTDGYKLGDAVRDISNNVYTSELNFNTFPLLTLTNNAWDLFNGQPLNIATWGDSLTFGTGSNGNGNYPSILSSLSGLNVFNGGIAAETSTQIKTRFLSDKSKWKLPTIFWVGRNNYASGVTVKADIAEMVSKLGHSNYLVVGIIKATSDASEPINTLNSDLKTIYGDRFVDMQSYLLSIYNPSITQDVIDHGNGVIAWSMRSDWLHLSNLGYSYVAKLLNTKIGYMLGRDKQVTSNITSSSIQITGNEQGLQPVKSIEFLYDTSTDKGVIEAYDRVNKTTKPLSIQYPLGSELRLVEQGGNVKIGDLPNYTTGSMYQLGLTTATLGILQRLPSGSTGRISKWTAQGVQGDSHFAETSDQISTPSGVGLSIGSTDYYIPPSATQGVLNVGGSSAQFITLSNNAYLYGSNTLTRLLSERDFDIVIGSLQRMAIDKLTGTFKINNLSGIGSRLVTADASGNLSAPTIPTAPTAAPGTNTTQIATTAFVQANARPYKTYAALLSQSGTSAPTATVLENTLGGSITWTRVNPGLYSGTLTGAFTTDKTILLNNNPVGGVFTNIFSSVNTITIQTRNSSNAQTDDGLSNTSIEIRVYN